MSDASERAISQTGWPDRRDVNEILAGFQRLPFAADVVLVPLGERGLYGDVKINFNMRFFLELVLLVERPQRALCGGDRLCYIRLSIFLLGLRWAPQCDETPADFAQWRRPQAPLPPLRQRPPMASAPRQSRARRPEASRISENGKSAVARREAAGQRILLESELRANFQGSGAGRCRAGR